MQRTHMEVEGQHGSGQNSGWSINRDRNKPSSERAAVWGQRNRCKHRRKSEFAYSQNTGGRHVHSADWLRPVRYVVAVHLAPWSTHQQGLALHLFHPESWTLVSAELELSCWRSPDSELYVAASVSGCSSVSGLFLKLSVGIRSGRSPRTGCASVFVFEWELNLTHRLVSLDEGRVCFHAGGNRLDIHSRPRRQRDFPVKISRPSASNVQPKLSPLSHVSVCVCVCEKVCVAKDIWYHNSSDAL